jgi:hypothetical protein
MAVQHSSNKFRDRIALLLLLACVTLLAGCKSDSGSASKTDKEKDHLKGRVKNLQTESFKLINESGEWVERPGGYTEIKTYDKTGNLIEATQHNFDGSLLVKTVYSYKTDGARSESVVTDTKGSVKEKTSYVYNSEGLMSEEANYNSEGSLNRKSTYEYDGEGRKIEWVLTNPRGAIADRWTYTYDTTGFISEESRFYADSSPDIKYIYKCDEVGNPIERLAYMPDGSTSEKEIYIYEFDSTGNWINRTASRWVKGSEESKFQPAEKIYRRISYF